MKILHIDLSEGFEDLSVYPNRYGGGQIVPSWYRELRRDSFYSLADPKSFENLREGECSYKCIPLSLEKSRALRAGEPLYNVIGKNGYDIVFHGHCDVWINTDVPTAVWITGQHQRVHPKNRNWLLHSPEWQFPDSYGIVEKVPRQFKVVIGKPVPTHFIEHKKEEIIFQCTNHAACFQSIPLAQICKKNKIPIYFGGPISEGYPLLDEVDHRYVFYLGVMKYDEKIKMTQRARIHTLLHNFPINYTLSGFEALAHGCSLITSKQGFWPDFITPEIGRTVSTAEEFVIALEETKKISQYDCWKRARENDVTVMVDSFEKAFKEILELSK